MTKALPETWPKVGRKRVARVMRQKKGLSKNRENPLFCRVPEGGLEPPRAEAHWILNPARLPIPPLRHYLYTVTTYGIFSQLQGALCRPQGLSLIEDAVFGAIQILSVAQAITALRQAIETGIPKSPYPAILRLLLSSCMEATMNELTEAMV